MSGLAATSVTFILLLIYLVAERYLIYLETPYFKFVRDTLSYTVLVVLHYALCLSPSTIAFSGLEWAILIFFVGRYLVERKQICDILQRIKPRRKKGDDDARAQSNIWFRLKTLSIYLRWLAQRALINITCWRWSKIVIHQDLLSWIQLH